jgi:cytochrome P450 family 307 subfamily A
MALLELFLFLIILIFFLINYLKLIFKCKRAIKISDEVLKQIKNSKITSNYLLQPPGPLPLPIIGNLAVLAKFSNPFEGFTALSKIYGDVFSLTLGSTRCVVVNDLETIKEVLINANFFLGRMNFEVKVSKIKDKFSFFNLQRFHRIFGGDRNNCELYKSYIRRNIQEV